VPLLDGLACAISMAEGLARQRPADVRAKPAAVESVGLSKGLAKLIGSP
jgi:allantoin racemase